MSVDVLHARFQQKLAAYKKKAEEKAKQENPNISESELRAVPLPKNSVVLALNDTFAYQWWSGGVFKIISDIGQSTSPLLSKRLIEYVMYRETEPRGKGIGYALGITALLAVSAFYLNLFFYRATMTGAQSRAVLSQAIYQKSLRLSGSARAKFTNGKLTNLLSTDCHRIDFALQWMHFGWTFPISLAICIVIVLTNIGVSGLVGFALLFVCFFVVTYCSRQMAQIRRKVNMITDKRVSQMREILHAMKIIKFYSWEDAYQNNILSLRKVEMHKIKVMLTVRNLLNSLFTAAPTLAGLLSFITMERTGHYLNPASVFSSLTTFNITRLPLMFLPLALMTSFEAYLASNRIQELLSAPEHEDYVEYDYDQKDAIVIENGGFIWEKRMDEDVTPKASQENLNKAVNEDSETTDTTLTKIETKESANLASEVPAPLPEKISTEDPNVVSETPSEDGEKTEEERYFHGFHNLDLKIKSGEFVVITGAIGSGKSSLLNAIAGSMKKTSGHVVCNGQLVFCGQQWVQNATVEQNILFGKPMNRELYERVIHDCSLTRDLEILPAGDQTEVGERGITVSGGQKARINLARAVYWDADIVLLDDVLSAVDAHVGKHIIDHCITGILKSKTRILATHQLSMLPYADRVIFLSHNGDLSIGTVEELTATNEEFNTLLTFSHNSGNDEKEEEEKEEQEEEEIGDEVTEIKKQLTEKSNHEAPKASGKLMVAEDKANDGVEFRVYKTFFSLGGGFIGLGIVPFCLLVLILSTFCQLFTNTWLSFWTADKFHGRTSEFYIGIFVMFGLLSAIFAFVSFYCLTFIGNNASLAMQDLAVKRVLHAPMSFFDTSPLGRVINRFSKDTDSMDNELSDQSRLLLLSLSSVIGVFILIIIYIPWFAIALVGLMVLYFMASGFYRASAREIKRLDSLGRSVMFSHFSETLNGITTIKGYNDEERFIKTMKTSVDKMNSAYYLTLVNQRWLTLRLDYIGTALTLVVTMLCVSNVFHINASSAGLVVSSLLQVVNMMSMVVRQSATVENEFNAVERIHAYAYDLPQEAAFNISETAPPKDWPVSGGIEFNDVELKYRENTPPVLHGVNLSIKGGEKIGICGRTGAGKSTIMVALYRMAELSRGSIVIDGLDIGKLGLHQLRSKLSIIPQDPVLFQGTVRSNIDPFGVASDEELLDALRRSWLITEDDMKEIKAGNPEGMKFGLDELVDDEGSNFSLGERQLLALTRALVRESKILILDEATSSVDFETDHKIQTTISKEFSHCTILCIAHRLNTILGYDKILVLDHGEVAEFDTPMNLFNKEDGIFRSMCVKSTITEEQIIAARE